MRVDLCVYVCVDFEIKLCLIKEYYNLSRKYGKYKAIKNKNRNNPKYHHTEITSVNISL